MQIDKERVGDAYVVTVHGRLDGIYSSAFANQVGELITGTNPKLLIERPFDSQDPIVRINLINEIRNLSFEEPGEYSILIEIDDEPLLATSLTVAA